MIAMRFFTTIPENDIATDTLPTDSDADLARIPNDGRFLAISEIGETPEQRCQRTVTLLHRCAIAAFLDFKKTSDWSVLKRRLATIESKRTALKDALSTEDDTAYTVQYFRLLRMWDASSLASTGLKDFSRYF